MLYIVKTSHPDSDSFTLHHDVIPQITKEAVLKKRYDCSDQKEFEKFLFDTQTISFLPTEKTVSILYSLKVSANESSKILALAESNDIVLMNPTGKSLGKSSSIKDFTSPITAQHVKSYISSEIKDVQLPQWLTINKILEKTGILDEMGNVYNSPLQAVIITKQIRLLQKNPEQLKELFEADSSFVSQWALLEKLFSNTAERMKYFEQLTDTYDVFELLNMIKHNLLLAIPISEALQSRMDTDSIAKTLKKHPFYIKNIATTIQRFSISPSKALSLLTRIIKVESKVKSGELDDAMIGLDTVLATADYFA
jgi:hypothetical protein